MRRLETQADILLSWLNGGPFNFYRADTGERPVLIEAKTDRARIKRLINNLQCLQAALNSLSDSTACERSRRRINWLEYNVAKCSRHYRVKPLFWADRERREIELLHFEEGPASAEYEAFVLVSELASAGLIDRIVRCSRCRDKWVFRGRKNQRYCSRKCRQRDYEASEKRKRQRRRYMREYYHKWLSADAKRCPKKRR